MVIKSKDWPAITAVKLICFALILVLAFAFCGTVFSMARLFDNSGNVVNLESNIVFENAYGNEFFYRNYVNGTVNDLRKLLFFESEENIKAGNCLRWVERNDGWWLESADGSRTWSHFGDLGETLNTLVTEEFSDHDAVSWGEPQEEQGEPYNAQQIRLQRESLERDAINNQLLNFRSMQSDLAKRGGLVYYVAKQGFAQSNTENPDMDFFLRQPVHLLIENGIIIAQSYVFNNRSYGNDTIYIGYTAEAIDAQNAYWQSIQRVVIAQIIAIIVMVVVAFALFVTLLCGAGRKRGDSAVYLNVLDKPYLDVSGVLLMLYETAVIATLSEISFNYGGSYIRDTANTRGILTVIAVGVVFMLAPALLYVMSFAKRVKVGRWWRHTLTWRMWDAVRSTCVSFAKSLWAGVPLTVRVLLMAFVLFCVMLIVAISGGANDGAVILAFFASIAAVVPMLRFARRLNKLEVGAKAVSEGRYGDIAVNGGTIGRIAESINNISAGIESAVDERLKSERLKTELITNVSHDIRTPLTSLITYTDLLKSEGLTSERAPEYLDILIQKSQRLKTLTDELFEAAKASSGNIETHIEALDFAALTKMVLGELDERIQSSGLDFRTNLPEHMWVAADGKLLWRAAENLLSNVFKYSLPHSRVYIDLAAESGFARLDIKNISAEPLNMEPSELTERFKRGDVSRSSEGSGLGLSIVQSFVEAQGGRFKLAIDGDLFKASISMPNAEPK